MKDCVILEKEDPELYYPQISSHNLILRPLHSKASRKVGLLWRSRLSYSVINRKAAFWAKMLNEGKNAKTRAKWRRFPATNKRVISGQAPKPIKWPGANPATTHRPALYHFRIQPSDHKQETGKWKISPLWLLNRLFAPWFDDESLWVSLPWLWAWITKSGCCGWVWIVK